MILNFGLADQWNEFYTDHMKLSSLQKETGHYTLLDLSQTEQQIELLGVRADDEVARHKVQAVQSQLMQQLARHTSGLIVDPRYAFPYLADKPEIGLAFRVLTQPTTDQLPQVLPQWGIDEVANNLALAVLTLPYHPAQTTALDKKKLIFELNDYCRYLGIDCLFELRLQSGHGGQLHPDEVAETQLTALQEFRSVGAAVIIEYPGSALAAATVTSQLDIPWLVTTAASSYQVSKDNIRTALENGCQGVVLGPDIWSELATFRNQDMSPDWSAITDFVGTTPRDRVIEIARIVTEAVAT